MPNPPRRGPVALCTLIARDGQALADAYCDAMHQQVAETEPLDDDTAWAIGLPQLAGCPSWLLANAIARQWLHIVEYPQAKPRRALHSLGWMAMEVLLDQSDALADSLSGSPFEILRPPADLDVSDDIRAFQARGPAGEFDARHFQVVDTAGQLSEEPPLRSLVYCR